MTIVDGGTESFGVRVTTTTAGVHGPPSIHRVMRGAVTRAATGETPLNCTCVAVAVSVIVVNRTGNPSALIIPLLSCDSSGSIRIPVSHVATVASGHRPTVKKSFEINGAESEDTKVETRRLLTRKVLMYLPLSVMMARLKNRRRLCKFGCTLMRTRRVLTWLLSSMRLSTA